MKSALRLTKAQRSGLFAGEHPRISLTISEAAAVEVGDVHHLSSNVAITVLGKQIRRGGTVVLDYMLRDDRPRLLRGSAKDIDFEQLRDDVDELGHRRDLDPAERRRAAEDSGYTPSARAAMANEPEAVDQATQERLTKESRAGRLDRWEGGKLTLLETLEDLEGDPEVGRQSSKIRYLRSQIDELDRRIRREAG
jgi:hypothetical protein